MWRRRFRDRRPLAGRGIAPPVATIGVQFGLCASSHHSARIARTTRIKKHAPMNPEIRQPIQPPRAMPKKVAIAARTMASMPAAALAPLLMTTRASTLAACITRRKAVHSSSSFEARTYSWPRTLLTQRRGLCLSPGTFPALVLGREGGRTRRRWSRPVARRWRKIARERVCTCASIPSPRSQVAREPASRTRWRRARPLGLALVRETPHPQPAESREHRLDYLEGMDRLAKLGTTAPSRSRTQTCVPSIEIPRPAKKSMSALLFQIPADSYRPGRSSSRPLPNIENSIFRVDHDFRVG